MHHTKSKKKKFAPYFPSLFPGVWKPPKSVHFYESIKNHGDIPFWNFPVAMGFLRNLLWCRPKIKPPTGYLENYASVVGHIMSKVHPRCQYASRTLKTTFYAFPRHSEALFGHFFASGNTETPPPAVPDCAKFLWRRLQKLKKIRTNPFGVLDFYACRWCKKFLHRPHA